MFQRVWSAVQWAFFGNPLSRRLGRPLAALHVWVCSQTMPSVEWYPETRRLETASEREGNEYAAYLVGFMQGSLLVYPMYAIGIALLFKAPIALEAIVVVFVGLAGGAAASQITKIATLPVEDGELNDRGIVEAGG
jgi:hypothetical protein